MSISVATLAKASELDVRNAPLPEPYEAAKVALAACQRVDECKDWADKAAALASYARQSDDDTLHKTAIRIQGRAVRRCGQLLEDYQSPGGRPPKTSRGAPTSLTQRQAADRAGMSKDQEVTARRVASIPEDEFEAAVESDDPPSVTTLSRPTGPGFAKARHLVGELSRFAEFCRENKPGFVASGLMEEQIAEVRDQATAVRIWLYDLCTELEES